jgi:type II secretory pathway pseudopilin PulG
MHNRLREAGFTLIEVLVAAGLLVTIAVGVAEIAGRAVAASAAARARTAATLAAVQRMEQLRALVLSASADAASGSLVRVTDLTTDLSVDPASDGGPGLAPSPPATLDDNVPPYVDYLDAAGLPIGRGSTPPPSAVYIRRWAVAALPEAPDDSVVLQVLVVPVPDAVRRGAGSPRAPAAAVRLVSLKSRRVS